MNEFGPFTPQELEKAVDWLQSKNLNFEISKDQKVEDLFRLNDGQNIVAQAEFRTEVYLAQIFNLKITDMTVEQVKEFQLLFSFAEKIPQRFLSPEFQEAAFGRKKKQQTKKMAWSWIMAIILGAPILFSILQILFKGE